MRKVRPIERKFHAENTPTIVVNERLMKRLHHLSNVRNRKSQINTERKIKL